VDWERPALALLAREASLTVRWRMPALTGTSTAVEQARADFEKAWQLEGTAALKRSK
jgi:hypothetical protein